MVESGGGLGATLEYNTDLFEGETVERMLEHLQVLLEGVAADAGQRVSELPVLTEAERREIVEGWNRTEREYRRESCIHELFEEQVRKTPHAIAVEYEGERLTYAELNGRANQLGHYLRERGVGPDVLVGICVERSLEMVVGLLGILKAGGAYVPIDPMYPAERQAYMLEDSGVGVLLTQERLLKTLPSTNAHVLCLDRDEAGLAAYSEPHATPEISGLNIAYMIYTSGSTGKPKGVQIQHSGLTNYLLWARDAYPCNEVNGAPVHSSVSFDLTVTSLFVPLISGSSVTLTHEELGVEGLANALRNGSEYSLVKITPAHLQLLSQQLTPEEMSGRTRAFVIGGENLTAETIAVWRKHAPQTRLINEYGPTETVVGCTIYEVLDDAESSGSIPIGYPIANTQIYILDANMGLAPVGVAGELYVGGAGLARGYWARPGLTAEKFVPDPFSTEGGRRLYRTGDLARYRADGSVEYLGRIDDQVKIRGFRIELGEIEARLEQHEAVRHAVAMAREDEPGDKRLVAYLVRAGDTNPAVLDLRLHLLATLPEYMVPTAFVYLPAIPMTSNGKVDRKALPPPELEERAVAPYEAPRNREEELMAQIWADVLKLERVGIHYNFFGCGGHSLLATQVIARARVTFEVDVPLRALFESPTIAGLCQAIERLKKSASSEQLPAIQRQGRSRQKVRLSGSGELAVEAVSKN